MQGSTCLDCGAPLTGRFCSVCGQKRIEPAERRFSWFFKELAGSLLGSDGRLRRSLAALILRPGDLGAAWLAGRRTYYASPLALFLLVNLVYFVAPPATDFNLPLASQFGQWFGPWAKGVVDARIAARGSDLAAYTVAFDLEAYSLAKLLIIVHPLMTAPVLWLLHPRRGIPLVDHLAIALHLWAALLVWMIVVPGIGQAYYLVFPRPELHEVPLAWKLALLLGIVWTFGRTLRVAYAQPLWRAVAKTPLAFIGAAFGHLYLYRLLLFLAAFALS